eukprot:s675_g38.t1
MAYLAGLELCRRSRVRREHVECWLGHVTSLFRLKPCLLSIFDKIYRFCRLDVRTRIPLWPSVRKEIRQACHLIWLARVDLGSPLVSQVDAGDSADHGYALVSCVASDWEIKRALQYREKWRFIPLPDDVKEALTLEDKSALLKLLESKAGISLSEVPIQDEFVASAGSGLGIDTQYGQWLQQVLADGDWLRTSAISSQVKARKKHRADIEYPALVEPVSSTLLRPSRFKLLCAKRWRDPSQHINLKEAMVALSSLKRTARVSSLVGSLKLTLCDNLAVVLAFEKGRSGSPALNRLCRVAASLQAGLGLGWRLRHIESPRNVSDGPCGQVSSPVRTDHAMLKKSVAQILEESKRGCAKPKTNARSTSGFCKTSPPKFLTSNNTSPAKSRARCWGMVIGNRDLETPTKTGLYDDCILLDSPGRSDLGIVMKYLVARCEHTDSYLFQGLTLHAYNKAIKKACDSLKLEKLRLTPHNLRHSGPSTDAYHQDLVAQVIESAVGHFICDNLLTLGFDDGLDLIEPV